MFAPAQQNPKAVGPRGSEAVSEDESESNRSHDYWRLHSPVDVIINGDLRPSLMALTNRSHFRAAI